MKPMTTEIHDVIKLNREKIIRIVLYTKIIERDLKLSENDLNVLCLFSDTDDLDNVVGKALHERFVKSYQSGINTVSKLVKLNLLEKVDVRKRVIDGTIFPKRVENGVAVKLLIHNIEN